MKKILIFIVLLVAARSLLGQRTLTINETWTSTHVESTDVIVPSGIVLTIDPGTTVRFASGKSLKITGTGSLLAGSLTGSAVIFTADDGISWGHIYCDNITSSYLRNCTIEKGNAAGLNVAYGPNYGGGVYAKTSVLTIENCTLQNNTAPYGGGLFVGASNSPSVKNTVIHSNTATEAGGGLYIWQSSSSIITNCIIYNNNCSGLTYGGGGVFLGYSTGNVRIINCVIANNTATNQGRGIYFYSSGSSRIINSIVWGGSGNPLYFNSTSTSVLQYSAIQSGSYSTCINLNSSNSASDGPNFLDPDLPGIDWSLRFKSPCRDAGTTPTPAVPLDYLGNSRIGPYEIGAYEIVFNRWKTNASSTDWGTALNWEQGIPSSSQNIAIPAGATFYPTGSPTQDYTIGADYGFVIDAGASVTLNQLTNNGTLVMNSTSTGIASLIMNGYTKGIGSIEEIKLYLTGGYVRGDPYFEGRWHYISSPFSAPLSVTPFTTETYDLARWVDGINGEGTFLPGWVAYDGFIYDIDDPLSPPPYSGTGFNTMLSGKGYNFWDNRLSYTYNLSGQLNTSDVVVSLDYAGDPTYQGFNLLGNPFPAGLDWEYIINNTTYPDLTGQGIYFTHNNVQYSYVSGVAVPEFGDPASSGVIPPMQGFFVKTYGAGNSITLSADAQVHSAPNRYKGKGSIPLIRLALKEDTMPGDETVIRFDEKALATLDNNFDAVKMFPSTTKTAIYSKIGTTKYSINGQPFPETFVEIPIVVNLEKSGDQVIKATRIDYLDNYTITLKDNTTGFTADLRTSPELSFFADAPGTITDRFILKVSSITTGTENPVVSKNIFNVYTGNSNINIQTISDDWEGKSGSVRVMDLSGRTFNNMQDAEFRKGSLIQIGAPAAKGMYVVEITSGVKRYVGKVIIK